MESIIKTQGTDRYHNESIGIDYIILVLTVLKATVRDYDAARVC